jgi:hypothetical protein
MDALPLAAGWPKHPYRGLDFYRETDARLFCERDEDVAHCADILLGFGTKILLLQGSSGAGKSSFLCAGLIPHLKHDPRRSFFLGGSNSVVRCTSDPLLEISRALVATLDGGGPAGGAAAGAAASGEPPIAAAVCDAVSHRIGQATEGPRDGLADCLVGALVELCAELPGKLILVLDQAEEVLTQVEGGRGRDRTADAFFRFLEDVYLRNVGARLVVALRTEYYGRFRDELRISDDRLGARPRSGGIEPYLLRPLRDKDALFRVIEAPAAARDDTGAPVYGFAFEPGLAKRIVNDLVQIFPHAAITPALQVVCSSLYARLTETNRTISLADYARLGQIVGISNAYLETGIAATGARSRTERDRWREVLHSLVSRQGGGTLVSLIATVGELETTARDCGIRGRIGEALLSLSRGAAPLLRGEPPDQPRNFSLKHDVLAVVLARWYAEHQGAARARKHARRWIGAIGLAAAAFCALFALFSWQRTEEAFRAKAAALDLTNRYAMHAPEGNFRRSLLLEVANLEATAHPGLHERITGDEARKHRDIVAGLRRVLRRAPWFAGRYRAVGLDPARGRVALLAEGRAQLLVLTVPNGGSGTAEPELRRFDLPAARPQPSSLRPAAGFVTGIGPAALVGGDLHYWESGEKRHCPIEPILPPEIGAGSWLRGDFVGGRLQVSTMQRQGTKSRLLLTRLDAAQLRACSPSRAAPARLRIVERSAQQPLPRFADVAAGPQLYEHFEETANPAHGARLAAEPIGAAPWRPVQLDAVIGSIDAETAPLRIAVGRVAPRQELSERFDYTLAAAVNARAMAVKFDGPDFYVYDLPDRLAPDRLGYVDIAAQHIAVVGSGPERAWRIEAARIPWVYPPFAAARIGQHWRAAWLGTNGVWAVESSDRDPGTATPILHDPLIGEPEGTQLDFTGDGQFLISQLAGLRGPVSVRIWDLRPAWQDWLDRGADERNLRELACRIVRMDGIGGDFDQTERELFPVAAAQGEPCPGLDGGKS